VRVRVITNAMMAKRKEKRIKTKISSKITTNFSM
jgi:hypothetical protein